MVWSEAPRWSGLRHCDGLVWDAAPVWSRASQWSGLVWSDPMVRSGLRRSVSGQAGEGGEGS